jgi:hypothetical protein
MAHTADDGMTKLQKPLIGMSQIGSPKSIRNEVRSKVCERGTVFIISALCSSDSGSLR